MYLTNKSPEYSPKMSGLINKIYYEFDMKNYGKDVMVSIQKPVIYFGSIMVQCQNYETIYTVHNLFDLLGLLDMNVNMERSTHCKFTENG